MKLDKIMVLSQKLKSQYVFNILICHCQSDTGRGSTDLNIKKNTINLTSETDSKQYYHVYIQTRKKS